MWLKRLELLIGNANINKLKNTTVAVIGIGGVGSMALESIVRSGISNIIIVDNDIINITNLNRQIISLSNNIGHKKIDVAYDRIKSVNKDCNIIKLDMFLDSSNIEELFKNKIDYIIDACDTIDTKILLIKECIDRNIKIISCMGAANKFNPSKLEIIDISKTSYDPIAKIMRKKLKDIGIKHVNVVCSTEKPLNLNKPVGSNSIVPLSAGILCASYVINDIIL
jgi:tRNA A37 threonylcarbamoyladenosine dehydratase